MAGKPWYPDYVLNMKNKTTAQWQLWGQLVKTWATGENRLGDGKSYPWPTTPAALQTQLENAGVAAANDGTVPAKVLAVTVVQMSEQHIIISLPSKHDILRTEKEIAKIKNPDWYALPDYYDCTCPQTPKVPNGQEQSFNDMRVGEYVISFCG